ncbi:cytochrome P450 4c3-like [Schistocerca piceifrons]|uniref:cytochrome P450 4c3-like n=1 Tax=Schistocerca piceifrons TaxID=274613 RepID=UPI001F5FBAD5|nr:cytochrome P450 4c3-like [Schistocerca piceifrons]
MLIYLVYFVVVIVFLLLLHQVVPYKFNTLRTHILIDKIPGPKGIPILGNALQFNVPTEEFIPVLKKIYDDYYPIYKIWFLGVAIVFIGDPDGVEKILSSQQHITKSDDYLILEPWLCKGLLTSTGTKWHERRKLLTPAFHFKILEDYVHVFNKNSRILVNKLSENTPGSTVNIFKYMTTCTLDIICETAMGTSVDAQNGGEAEYVAAVKRMSELFLYRQLRFWVHMPLTFRLCPVYHEQNHVLNILHGFTERIIKERKEEFRSRNANERKNLKSKRISLLDLLVEVAEQTGELTDLDIREEVDTFMFEGHDTTAASLTWTIFLIGLHPHVQEKIEEELEEIFGESDREVKMEDLNAMKYLEQVIKESLRLYPSVPQFGRKLDVDHEIHGYKLPAGTHCVVMPLFMHLNPELYPEPYKFDPDRFTPDKIQGRHPFAYLPFSAGPRNCIGQKFAIMEEKIVLSTLLRSFRIESLEKPEDIKLTGELILRPKDGIRVKLTRKQRNSS